MKIQIHKEGKRIVVITFLILILLYILISRISTDSLLNSLVAIAFLAILVFLMRFFRVPERTVTEKENLVFSAADGKVVAIEEVFEKEYFNDKRIQVSVFMSVWDVHINWFPIKGKVKYFKYHPGKYLAAYKPKSSLANEQTHIGLENQSGKIFFKQIVGILARRLVWDIKEGSELKSGQRFGMMKFGSRMDVALPIDSEILVKTGDKVK
ncbi:MAG: phosphatidylserine decarboxylase family protein, partial [Bacteroidales bacterium]